MSAVATFLRLPVRLQILLLAAAALQTIARVAVVAIRVDAVDRTAVAAGRLVRWRTLDADLIAWATSATAARIGGTCLTQAVAARVLLGWAGVPCRLVIGVRRRDTLTGPEFHAWVEGAGIRLPGPDGGDRFVALTAWPRS